LFWLTRPVRGAPSAQFCRPVERRNTSCTARASSLSQCKRSKEATRGRERRRTESDAESGSVHVPPSRDRNARDGLAKDGQEREREEEVPVDAVLGDVLLQKRASAESSACARRGNERTG